MFVTASSVAAPAGHLAPTGGQSSPTSYADTLTKRVRDLVMVETEKTGDPEAAMRVVARRTGVGFWTISNIRRGRAKTVDMSIFERIRAAYLDLCARQIEALQHEILMSQEANPDAAFDDLFDEVHRLAARLADARSGSLASRARVGLHSRMAARKRGSASSTLTPHSEEGQ